MSQDVQPFCFRNSLIFNADKIIFIFLKNNLCKMLDIPKIGVPL